MPATDRLRAAVYAAELQVRDSLDRVSVPGVFTVDFFGSALAVAPERLFSGISDVAAYVEASLHEWNSRHQQTLRLPQISKCAPSKTAHYSFDSSTIFLPPGWAMRELVVLHELAHHITMHTTKSQAHGPEFAANYLELVSFSMSKEVSLLLRAAFDGQQISVSERV